MAVEEGGGTRDGAQSERGEPCVRAAARWRAGWSLESEAQAVAQGGMLGCSAAARRCSGWRGGVRGGCCGTAARCAALFARRRMHRAGAAVRSRTGPFASAA